MYMYMYINDKLPLVFFNSCLAFAGLFDPAFHPTKRYKAGYKLLENILLEQETSNQPGKSVDVMKAFNSMRSLLRNEESGICQRGLGRMGSLTTASQISLLSASEICPHYFTATPDPTRSVFKPFVFLPNDVTCFETPLTQCETPDTAHALYKAHSQVKNDSDSPSDSLIQQLRQLEEGTTKQVSNMLGDVTSNERYLRHVFKRSCQQELDILQSKQ